MIFQFTQRQEEKRERTGAHDQSAQTHIVSELKC